MSVPHSNSTQTMLMPWEVDDRTRRTPVAPLTAVSSGKVTSVSPSSGAMPCASVRTVTVGAVRSGKTSTGILVAVIVPATRSSADAATTRSRFRIDQRMSASSMSASSVRVSAGELAAGHGSESDLVGPRGDDHVAGVDAGPDQRVAPVTRAERQDPLLERLAAELHVGNRGPVVVDDRRRWHHHPR